MGLAERERLEWSAGALLTGLLAVVAAFVLTQGDDGLFTPLLVLGVAGIALGVLGLAREIVDRGWEPTGAAPPPEVAAGQRRVVIRVQGDHDTITVNILHLLGASWATTVDLADGTSLVARADGQMLEVHDSAGRIIRAKVDGSGAVSVGSASEAPIIVSALRALAGQLMGAGLAYEPSVTVRAVPEPALPAGSV